MTATLLLDAPLFDQNDRRKIDIDPESIQEAISKLANAHNIQLQDRYNETTPLQPQQYADVLFQWLEIRLEALMIEPDEYLNRDSDLCNLLERACQKALQPARR